MISRVWWGPTVEVHYTRMLHVQTCTTERVYALHERSATQGVMCARIRAGACARCTRYRMHAKWTIAAYSLEIVKVLCGKKSINACVLNTRTARIEFRLPSSLPSV